jgi:hypothetical protein
MMSDKVERIIKQSLFEQAPYAPGFGPNAPAQTVFQKAAFQTTGQTKYANPAYDSTSPGLQSVTDFASLNKKVGVAAGMLPMWKNQAAYNELMKLGGRPFAATKAQGSGNLDVIPLAEPDLQRWLEEAKAPSGGIITGVQIAMYNHPNRQVGMMVYFYENPNKMYFAFNIYGAWKYVNWTYESMGANSQPVIFLTRGGHKDGWITRRGTYAPQGEVVFVDIKDPGLKDIMKSDYIQSLRQWSGIESAFKHNEPTIVKIFGYDVNLTALADRVQMAFDWIGIVFPPLDVINACWYVGRGRYFEAFLSIIALIPGFGDAVAVIFRPLVKLFNATARGSKAIWKTLLTKAAEKNISADIILKLFPDCVKFVEAARSAKILSQQQADEMVAWLQESKGFIVDFMKQDAAAKLLAKQKALQKKLAKRLGYEYADEAAAQATTNIFKRLWQRTGANGLTQLVANVFKTAGRTAYAWAFKRSTNYWKAAYTVAYKQFGKILYKDPKKVAMCILSFGDTKLTRQFTDVLITSLTKILPQRNGKIVFRQVNSRGVEYGYTILMTPKEFRAAVTKNLPKALEQLLWRSKTSYNALVDSLVAAAAKPGQVINGYWTAFWTDPLRRFVNEYSVGRFTSKFTGGVAGTVKNFASDMVDGLKQLVTSQDFLKRIDIIYNEFQEVLERADYGTEKGSGLNQQSVIFALVDAGWTELTGTPIVESLRAADEKMKEISPTLDYLDKVDNENMMQGDLDSLNFQAVISDKPGGVTYKLAYFKKLVDGGILKYAGGNSGQWIVIKDSRQEGMKKGDVYQINKQGVISKVGQL